MTKLDKIVSNVLVGECFVCLRKLNPIITNAFNRLVLGGIWLAFIGMVYFAKASVVAFDLSFGVGLIARLAKKEKVCGGRSKYSIPLGYPEYHMGSKSLVSFGP